MPEPKTLIEQTEKFLTRRELAERWRCSGETCKRRQRDGKLHPVYLSQRKLLYRLSEVLALETSGRPA